MKRLWLASLLLFAALAHADTYWGLSGAFSVPKGVSGVLGSLRAANMNTTADQAITILTNVTAWEPTGIQAMNCSGSFTLAAGGVYPAASKGGTALVGSLQSYSSLTGATIMLPMTLGAGVATTRYTITTVYFSLTTAAGAAATCDIYIMGVDLT